MDQGRNKITTFNRLPEERELFKESGVMDYIQLSN
jgi:hypothetical protein